ncbi:MAG: carboxypeptidase-like regulatory domain-containing protein [Verrucomicrobia bacterium]|nr:carboxypeptidase-like regulatory domain-containing protein [Actinomycetota bacterium]MBU4246832.1 carboxypeptidase-like regulatory domain-containing protein [Verrucomicrobiota bacterium]MCG2681026.1 carboxypeptidase-like regulatory domain-containing protein [Kiritimatiellia bacterium]
MKQIRPCVDFNLFAICVLVGLSAAISGYGQDVPNVKSSKPATTVPASYEIHGTVIDMTPDISDASIAKLEHAFINSDAKQILSVSEAIGLGSVPRLNVVVRLRGDSVNGAVNLHQPSWWDNYDEILERMLKEWAKPDTGSMSPSGSVIKKGVVTDSRGNFEFIGLPAGVYQISAEAPANLSETGMQRMASLLQVPS